VASFVTIFAIEQLSGFDMLKFLALEPISAIMHTLLVPIKRNAALYGNSLFKWDEIMRLNTP